MVSRLSAARWRNRAQIDTFAAVMAVSNRPDAPTSVGERLRLIRRAYGALQRQGAREISQAEFARLCDISPAAWNNAETGDNRLGLDNAINVSRRTGASLDYIYLGDVAHLPHALAAEIEKLAAEPAPKLKRA